MDYISDRTKFVNSKTVDERCATLKQLIFDIDKGDKEGTLDVGQTDLENYPHLNAAYLALGTISDWDYWADYKNNQHEKRRIFIVDEIYERASKLELPPPHDKSENRDQDWQKILDLAKSL